MPTTATIKSKTKDGADVELTVDKSGANTAKLTAKNWTVAKPPPANPKVSETKLFNATVSADNMRIACKADVFGPDPDVTLVLNAPASGSKSVTITIKGTLGGLGDGTETYPLEDMHFAAIQKFIADAQYPVA